MYPIGVTGPGVEPRQQRPSVCAPELQAEEGGEEPSFGNEAADEDMEGHQDMEAEADPIPPWTHPLGKFDISIWP